MNSLPGYWDEKEVARRIGKSERTLALWRQQRVGPPWTKLGKSVLYREEAVWEWLRSQEQQPVAAKHVARRTRRMGAA